MVYDPDAAMHEKRPIKLMMQYHSPVLTKERMTEGTTTQIFFPQTTQQR